MRLSSIYSLSLSLILLFFLSFVVSFECPHSSLNGSLPVNLPDDFKLHPQFQTEWYYVTGNLFSVETAKKIEYQLTTFFNNDPYPYQVSNLVVTSNEGHYSAASVGVGSFSKPFNVGFTSKDMNISYSSTFGTPGNLFSGYHFTGNSANSTIDLQYLQLSSAMYQDQNGYTGIPNPYLCIGYYYYSMPFLLTSGTIKFNGNSHKVLGISWFDHQYGTVQSNPLTPHAKASWIWLGLHLEVGSVIITIPRASNGTSMINLYQYSWINVQTIDGTILKGKITDFNTVTTWTSLKSNIVYPSTVEISTTLSSLEKIIITPTFLDQEVNSLGNYYWEGGADITGSSSGIGFLELVGFQ
jgi:predicted secreted hydrolase